MNKPSFEIRRLDGLIIVQLKGQWNSTIDLEYLSELGRMMQQMRQSTWALIADLRDWHIDEETAGRNTHYTLHLDRCNQTSECWIVRSHLQAQHLDPFFEELKFKPKRVLNPAELEHWAEQENITLVASTKSLLFPG